MSPWWWVLAGSCAAVIFGGNILAAYLRRHRKVFRPPGAEEAIRLVWVETYGQSPETTPHVKWELTSDGGLMLYDQKVAGYTLPTGQLLCVVGWATGHTFSQSALAHELWHCVLIRRGADTPEHGKPGEDPGFLAGGMVDRANRALIAWQPKPPAVVSQ